jgi:hypothetical protein
VGGRVFGEKSESNNYIPASRIACKHMMAA